MKPSTYERLKAGETKVWKQFLSEVKATDDEGRRFTFVITTGDVDRDKDIIAPDGWDLGNYLKNPVVMWAHDYSQPPVAMARTIERTATGLASEAEFIDPAVYPFAGVIAGLVRVGALRATSVGFRPLDGGWKFNDERKGVDFTRQELLEFSIVPIPANPNALIVARGEGVDVEPLREWAAKTLEHLGGGAVVIPPDLSRVVAAIEAALPALKTYSIPKAPATCPECGTECEQCPDCGATQMCPKCKVCAKCGATMKAAAPTCAMGEECPNKGKPDAECEQADCPMKKALDPAVAGAPRDSKAVDPAVPVQHKRGRVLSASNERKLRDAHEAIGGVLAQVAEQPENASADGAVAKSFMGYQTAGYTAVATGASSPAHVHDYGLYVDTRTGTFEGGFAYDVASHGHRITLESLARGETEESDGHRHGLMPAGSAGAPVVDEPMRMDATPLVSPKSGDDTAVTADAGDIDLEHLDDEDVFALDDEDIDDLDTLSAEDVGLAVKAALTDVVASQVDASLRRALNLARGRVD